MEFYVFREDEQKGPFSEHEIAEMIELNLLSKTDLVWKEGMADWKPLSEVSGAEEALHRMDKRAQAANVPQYDKSRPADPSRRIIAKLIDGFLTVLTFIPVIVIPLNESNMGAIFFLSFLAVLAFVQISMLTAFGQSVGKKVMRIKIVKVIDGQVANFTSAIFLRMSISGFFYGIPGLGLLLATGSLVMLFLHGGRCVHDYLAGTRVVDIST